MQLEIIKYFALMIEKETGIIFQESNYFQLQSRLEDIIKLEKLPNVEALHDKFRTGSPGPLLMQRLLDHSTNNETLFFRDPSFFPAFEKFVVDVILPTKPIDIRVWSSASSTGQEALSVAMTLQELSSRAALPPFSILGTDISERALRKAQSGFYTDFETSRGLPEVLRAKYFQKGTDGWKVKESLLNKITFKASNLLKPTIGSQTFHVILCRNVLIYQKVEKKAEIVNGIISHLVPDGCLMLGVGETLVGITDTVNARMIGNVIVYETKKSKLAKAA